MYSSLSSMISFDNLLPYKFNQRDLMKSQSLTNPIGSIIFMTRGFYYCYKAASNFKYYFNHLHNWNYFRKSKYLRIYCEALAFRNQYSSSKSNKIKFSYLILVSSKLL